MDFFDIHSKESEGSIRLHKEMRRGSEHLADFVGSSCEGFLLPATGNY